MRSALSDWTIRAAREADLDALAAILVADPETSWDRRSLAAELATAWAHLDLLVDGETVLGFAAFWHVADELQLLYIATHPDHLRRGVARRLLEHLRERVRVLDLERITLEVGANNRGAIALYETGAFEVVGRRPGYYKRGVEDAILMTWTAR